MNKCNFLGRLTGDPETKYLQSGTMVANFSLATNYSFKKNNQWEEKVSFANMEGYSKVAEKIATLRKGQLVQIEARYEQTVTEKDGKKNYWTKFVVNSILKAEHIKTQQQDGQNYEVTQEANFASGDIPF